MMITYLYAGSTAELGAKRAHNRALYLIEADEALEYLFKVLPIWLLFFSLSLINDMSVD